MLPKVMAHLSSNTKFTIVPGSLTVTASEVIYGFLRHSGRVLPHQHLWNDYHEEDREFLAEETQKKRIWTERGGKQYELENRFAKKKAYSLGRCLFQFPAPELNSGAAL
jgi:hypothetical protein